MLRTLWARGASLSGLFLMLILAPISGGAAFQASQLPIGYWPLDEAASPSLNSAGAYGTGTWSGPPVINAGTPPLITYANPSCLYFDGGNDVVDLANSPELENVQENSYSYSAWFRPEDVPVAGTNEGVYAIVAKTGWHMDIHYRRGDGTGQFGLEHWLTGDAYTGTGGPNGQTPGVWYHVAAVIDRPAGTGRLFVNGTQAGGTITFAANAATREFGTSTWKIGNANPAGAYGSWRYAAKGRIDDVRIYNYALTTDQVKVLSAGVPVPLNVTATGVPEAINVTWDAPTANSVAYTYTIVRIDTNGNRRTLAIGYTGTSYVDAVGGIFTYTYEITAVSVAVSGPALSNTATSTNYPPRYNDHAEGTKDGNCACGTAASASPLWAAGLGLVLLLGLLIRRGI